MTVIKRYSNRKLYDTQAKRYITLEGLAALIREGEPVKVVDHDTGQDITALIQTQIIFELERHLGSGLPRSVLTGLIQASNETVHRLRAAFKSGDWKDQVNAEIERRIRVLVRGGEISEAAGHKLLAQLLGAGEALPPAQAIDEEELERYVKEQNLPTHADLQRLEQQVDALAAELQRVGRGRRK